MTSPEYHEPILACDMQAISPEQRSAHRANTERLFALSQQVRELPTGYAVCLPGSALEAVASFIRYERLCCPFLRFTLEIEPEQGPILLSLTSSVDVKPFLRAEGLFGL
ncbi:hypothetical protein [Ktedonospora formicarum]|uniref:Uncharacterized protein n=1 Tax=Ktedonospora formicarum TaxID=2778364 RepID=A0A8J3MXA9_9CHLR|nr:hypothetical protein [Ktedonospora formicarum]GHO49558.1 hypothetical protein KSX_77210 [Ktedonospora formicarum]